MQNDPNPSHVSGQEKFVESFEKAIMQYVILAKAQKGEVTRADLQQTFSGNLQMTGSHFEHCIDTLVKGKHLRAAGDSKYTITDDGREDVQKLQHLVMELPNVISQHGPSGTSRPGQTQTATHGPSGTVASSGGNTTTKGQDPTHNNPGQPKSGGANTPADRR